MGRKHLASQPRCFTKQLITNTLTDTRDCLPCDSTIDLNESSVSKHPIQKRPFEHCSTCPTSDMKKSVSFADLSIRTYGLEIGDHPFCEVGCPLTLDWEIRDELRDISLDDYEKTRCKTRKPKGALRTTCEERRRRLIEDGYSEMDLKRAERKMHRARSCEARLAERDTKKFFSEIERPQSVHNIK